MTLPVVKPDLIRTLGEQMRDREYLAEVEKAMFDENEDLFKVCVNSLEVADHIALNIVNSMGEKPDPEAIEAINALLVSFRTVGRTTIYLLYQALKQQQICDELSDA